MRSIFFLWYLLFACATSAQDTLNYPFLVHRLYDLRYLANPPQIGEQSGNSSSYDRQSRYDTISNTYVQWSANDDGTGYIRKEGNDIVIFDKDGPGVIWRFWSALAKDGHIKIFIDNEGSPVLDKPFRDFFETFENDIPPINFPNLVMTLSRGKNRFLPIPFDKHCKILLSENWGAYYQVTYTKYPSKTRVVSYPGKMSRSDCIALAEADRFLGNRGYETPVYPEEKIENIRIGIKPGKKILIRELIGNKAITSLKFYFDGLTEDSDKASLISHLWLRITWDSDKTPAVFAPLGMFFGTGNAVHPYRSLPLGIVGDEMYSSWFMPFSKKATIELLNKGDTRLVTACRIIYIPLLEPADHMLRFHALWHDENRYNKSETTNEGDFVINNLQDDKNIPAGGRDIDWPLLKTRGKGRFCGLTLHVENKWIEPEHAAETWWYGKWDKKTIDWWWGEGDEKFFVDGEKFPSTFGTGSEDYIGFAWSAEPPFPTFESPFASQPFTPVNGNGHTIVNRFHISDNIPFQDSFEAYIEKFKKDRWGLNNTCLYDVVVYWYQEEKE